MSEQAKYGSGVLNHGEVITDKDTDRLVAKRAFLQLFDYLIRHEEVIKAARLAASTPWNLEEDGDIERMATLAQVKLQPFVESARGDHGKMIAQIAYDEGEDKKNDTINLTEEIFTLGDPSNRVDYIYSRTMAQNPATVLDIGAGWGYLPYKFTKNNIHVTAFAPYLEAVKFCHEKVAEDGLTPITWINEMFSLAPLKGTKYDVVLACEILEHVYNDADFLMRAVSCCKKATIITSPFGSVDKGLPPGVDMYSIKRQHIRAYSYATFGNLLNKLQKFYEGKLVIRKDTIPEGGQPNDGRLDRNCFTAVIEKDLNYDYTSIEEKLA